MEQNSLLLLSYKGHKMKIQGFIIGFVAGCLLAMAFVGGYIAGEITNQDPTPEQCLSVCVEEFEKMAQ